MKPDEMILHIKTPDDWDNVKFVEDIANNRPISFAGCDVRVVSDIFASFKDEIVAAITRDGLSNLMRRQLLMEALVPRGRTRSFVGSIMVKFLQELGVDAELIVVDPYFFAPTSDSDYPSLVEDIIRPFSGILSTVRVVTLPHKVDASLKKRIEDGLKKMNPPIQVTHTISSDYHDRFWITANRSNGILTGSSLNGLGRRYAIIDRLTGDDVADIVVSLSNGNLI